MRHRCTRICALFLGSALSLAATTCSAAGETKWTYAGATGPAKWGNLNPDFYVCNSGLRQSPIDISDAKADLGSLP
ncbi:MAG: hypothetical protein ABI607_14940, partial [Betaproteobacteria bacterium]